MRTQRRIDKDLSGSVTFHPETAEDSWQLFQLLDDGDLLTASDDRKTENGDRVRVRLTLKLEGVREKASFDPATGQIRVSGRNTEGGEHVKLGVFHTFELAVRHAVTLYKARWDQLLHLPRLRDIEQAAAGGGAAAEVAVVMLEAGRAQVCVLGQSLTSVRGRVEVSVPKKRAGSQGHEQGMARFYEAVLQSLLRHVDLAAAQVVVLASPGFVKDDFLAFALREAASRDAARPVLENRAKFVLAHAASGHARALPLALADPAVAARLAETRASGDVAALARFFEMLGRDAERAQYGWRHVRAALDRGAVELLIVCDSLLRVRDEAARKTYAALVAEARGAGARVFLTSSMHATGAQVAQLGGLCAVLRFTVHDLEDAVAEVSRVPGSRRSGAGAGASAAAEGVGAWGEEDAPQRSAGTGGWEDDSDASSDSDESAAA